VSNTHDLIIVGGGFGGAVLAMIARRLGLRAVLVERGRHPRFAIGESSTPLSNLLLEELGDRYDLPTLVALSKWGSWQREHPDLPVGLKRGFTFYHHQWDQPLFHPAHSQSVLMVAASPNDILADTHWYRPGFDEFLVHQAVSLGTDYLDETQLESIGWTSAQVEVAGRRHGTALNLRAPLIVDATGPRGFLVRHLALDSQAVPGLEGNQGLFAHFSGVHSMVDTWGMVAGAPYPADSSATHHCFPGGWIWVLPFNNGMTSAGVSLNREMACALNLPDASHAWERLLSRFPTVQRQFSAAQVTHPFQHIPQLPYRCSKAAGSRWALLPAAAGFADPLLSSGFALTLSGIQRLALLLEREPCPSDTSLAAYGASILRDQDAASLMVSGLHRCLGAPRVFNQLLMLYFAAVSYAETARRLGRPQLCPGFLLSGRPDFWEPVERLLREIVSAPQPPWDLEGRVRSLIAPVNLCDWLANSETSCYGVDVNAIELSAKRLGANWEEIGGLRRRLGL
jgi:FADH2 O2-dependent halogenase